MWTTTSDRIIKVGARWVRASAVLVIEPGDHSGTARVLLSSGDRIDLPMRNNETVDDIARLFWPGTANKI